MTDDHMEIRAGRAVLFRSYAKTPETVTDIVDRAVQSAAKAQHLWFFDQILFMVPEDRDCGETAGALATAFKAQQIHATVITAKGNENSDVLNVGFEYCHSQGMNVLVASNKAHEFLTKEIVERLFKATDSTSLDGDGCAAAGLRLPEFADAINPLQNTFAVWVTHLLVGSGGFDAPNGVEEVAALLRIAKTYGQLDRYFRIGMLPVPAELDIRSSSDGKQKHTEVKDTKAARQLAEAERVGSPLSVITDHVVELTLESVAA